MPDPTASERARDEIDKAVARLVETRCPHVPHQRMKADCGECLAATLAAERQAALDEACKRGWAAVDAGKCPADIMAAVKGECGEPHGVCYCGGCVM